MAQSITRYLSLLAISALLAAGIYCILIQRMPTPPAPIIITPQPDLMERVDSENYSSEESEEYDDESTPAESEGDSEEEEDTSVSSEEESSSATRHIFFDLNSVLFEISAKQALSSIGAVDIAGYKLSGKSTDDLENKVFEILGYLEPATPEHIQETPELPQQNKKPFPPIMCRWLRGEMTGQDLLNTSIAFMENPAHEQYFTSKREKRLVENVLRMMVDAETRCKLLSPSKKMIALVKQCKELNHKVYLFANTDAQFIALMQAKHPDIFTLFDGIVISAHIGSLKPGSRFFETIFKQYHISPKNSYFIDGAEEVVACIQAKNIPAIRYVNDDHNALIKTLQQQQILTA